MILRMMLLAGFLTGVGCSREQSASPGEPDPQVIEQSKKDQEKARKGTPLPVG